MRQEVPLATTVPVTGNREAALGPTCCSCPCRTFSSRLPLLELSSCDTSAIKFATVKKKATSTVSYAASAAVQGGFAGFAHHSHRDAPVQIPYGCMNPYCCIAILCRTAVPAVNQVGRDNPPADVAVAVPVTLKRSKLRFRRVKMGPPTFCTKAVISAPAPARPGPRTLSSPFRMNLRSEPVGSSTAAVLVRSATRLSPGRNRRAHRHLHSTHHSLGAVGAFGRRAEGVRGSAAVGGSAV